MTIRFWLGKLEQIESFIDKKAGKDLGKSQVVRRAWLGAEERRGWVFNLSEGNRLGLLLKEVDVGKKETSKSPQGESHLACA